MGATVAGYCFNTPQRSTHRMERTMATNYTHGVRTTASPTGWVQTGFTSEQAQAEADRLNAEAILPDVTYEAARV